MNRLLPFAGFLCLIWCPFFSVAQTTELAPSATPVSGIAPTATNQAATFAFNFKKVYTHQQFTNLAQKHQVMAVLPVTVTIEEEEDRKWHLASNHQLQQRAQVEANNAYHTLYAALLMEKSFHHASINFQDIATTQEILAEQHITPAMYNNIPPEKLAALLNVDGVVMCQIVRDRKLVREANFLQNLKRSKGRVGPTAGTATCTVLDGKTGQMLWQFERQLTERTGWNISQTLTNVSRNMADAFPYFKVFCYK